MNLWGLLLVKSILLIVWYFILPNGTYRNAREVFRSTQNIRPRSRDSFWWFVFSGIAVQRPLIMMEDKLSCVFSGHFCYVLLDSWSTLFFEDCFFEKNAIERFGYYVLNIYLCRPILESNRLY